MRIGLDVAPLLPPFTGIANYELYLLDALMRLDDGISFHGFDVKGWRAMDRPALDAIARAFGKVLPGAVQPLGTSIEDRRPGLVARSIMPMRRVARSLPLARRGYHAFRRLRFTATAPGRGLAAFHAFGYVSPGPSAVPAIPVIYDMSITRHAETHPLERRRIMAPMYEQARRAPFVHTISEFSKREIVELIGIPEERVVIAYPGVSAAYLAPPRDVPGTLARFGVAPGAFCLTVSTIEPRKNLKTLVAAFARLPPRARQAMPLCVVGAKGWGDIDLPQGAAELLREGTLRFLGYVSEDELAALYATCKVMLYPSIYEGFGMPIVEAMALGAPVIASDAASMPEAAGGHGRLVPPLDVDAWTNGLADAVDDTAERVDLAVAARRAHAATFSWDQSAKVVQGIYRRLA